jgi:hypothetical protein
MNEIRSSGMPSVDIFSTDTTTRYESYRSTIHDIYPEISTTDVAVRIDGASASTGGVVQMVQIYRNLRVYPSVVWLRVLNSGKATYAGCEFHKELDLPNESYLAEATNQSALIERAEAFSLGNDYVKISAVEPIVYVTVDKETNVYTYQYALRIIPDKAAPAKIVNWASGTVLLEEHSYENIGGHVYNKHNMHYWPATWQTDRSDEATIVEVVTGGQMTQTVNQNGQYNFNCANNPGTWQAHANCRIDVYRRTGVNDHYISELKEYPGGIPTTVNETWDETSGDHGLECANGLYWLNNVVTKVERQFPFYGGGDNQVKFVVSDDPTFAGRAWYRTNDGTQYYGEVNTGTIHGLEAAYFPDVLQHEISHCVSFKLFGGGIGELPSDYEGQSIAEGLADYIAGHYQPEGLGYLTFPWEYRSLAPPYFYSNLVWHYNHGHSWGYDPWEAGGIICGAYSNLEWDLERPGAIIPSGQANGTDYALHLLVQTILTRPGSSMPEYAYRTYLLDDDDDDPSTTPNGYLLYKSFLLRHGIPCYGSEVVNCWDSYGSGTFSTPRSMNTDNENATGTTSGSSMCKSDQATYLAHIDDGRVIVSVSLDHGTNWTQQFISVPGEAAYNATISVNELDQANFQPTAEEVYVAYLTEYSGLVLQRGQVESWDPVVISWALVDLGVLPTGGSLTRPVIVAQGIHPTLLVGQVGGENPGIHYWRAYDRAGMLRWNHGMVTGSAAQSATSLAAYTWTTGAQINIAWVSQDHVYTCAGVPNDAVDVATGYNWPTDRYVELTPGGNYNDNTNVTICNGAGIPGIFVAWQCNNTAIRRGRTDILIRKCKMTNISDNNWNVDWSAAPTVISRVQGSVRAPHLYPYTNSMSDYIAYGRCRVGLVYEQLPVLDDMLPTVMWQGLGINASFPDNAYYWSWLSARTIGTGRGASISTAVSSQSFEFSILYTSALQNTQGDYSVIPSFAGVPSSASSPPPEPNIKRVRILDRAEYWYPPICPDREIVIRDGGSLNIVALEPDSVSDGNVIEMPESTILRVEVGGSLNITGRADNSLLVKSMDSSLSWSGIKVEGGSLVMDHVQMSGTDSSCVVIEKPSGTGDYAVDIRNCEIDGSTLVKGADAIRIMNNPGAKVRLDSVSITTVKGGAGIAISNGGGDDAISHVTVENSLVGVSIQGRLIPNPSRWDTAAANISNLDVKNCTTGLSLSSNAFANVSSSKIKNNATGVWCNNSHLAMKESAVRYNSVRGVHLLQNAVGLLTSDSLSNNGTAYSFGTNPPPDLPNCGLAVQTATAKLKCCYVGNNIGAGIGALSSAVYLADPGASTPAWGWNTISSNNGDSVQISAPKSDLLMDNGRNTILGSATSGKRWIVNNPAIACTRQWRNNWWGRTDTTGIKSHLPSYLAVAPVQSAAPNACGNTPQEDTDLDAVKKQAEGDQLVQTLQYSDAVVKFKDVIAATSPCNSLQPSAIKEVVSTDVKAGTSANSTSYFKSIADSTTVARDVRIAARYAQAASYANIGHVDSAVVLVQALLDTARSDSERVEAKVELLSLNLLERGMDTTQVITGAELQAVTDSINYLRASLNVWTNYEIMDSVVMYAPITITQPLSIAQPGKLEIRPAPGVRNAVVTFTNNSYIAIGPHWYDPGVRPSLYVHGEPDNPIILDALQDTLYAFLNVYGKLEMRHAKIRGRGICTDIQTTAGEYPIAQIDSCEFSFFDDGIYFWQTDTTSHIRNCTLRNMGGEDRQWGFGGSLGAIDGANLLVENCDIQQSGGIGFLNYYNGTNVRMINNRIQGSASYGLLSWEGGDMTMECNTVTGNGDSLPELQIEDGFVDLEAGHNIIGDSSGTLIYASDPSMVDLQDGQNKLDLFTGNGRYLSSGTPSETWNVSMNTWSPVTPADTSFYSHLYPQTPARWLVDSSLASFLACGESGTSSIGGSSYIIPSNPGADRSQSSVREGEDETEPASPSSGKSGSANLQKSDSPAVAGFGKSTTESNRTSREAMTRLFYEDLAQLRTVRDLERSGNADDATRAAMAFVQDHPQSTLMPAALVKLAGYANKDNRDLGISNLLAQQAQRLSNPKSKALALRMSSVALAREGNPALALTQLEEQMQNASTREDSIKARSDAIGIYFLNRHEIGLTVRDPQIRSESLPEMIHKVVALAKVLHNPEINKSGATPAVPASYCLYQNFPNPFNPTTEIRFDLPEAVRVELKVFNLLGQEVASLVDQVRPAGSYRIMWDSKSATGSPVASGMYVYQIKAGKFTDAKKMMLIR